MRRRLFNFLAAVSLLLCVVTVALWVRSYRWKEGVNFGAHCSAFTRYGRLVLTADFNEVRLGAPAARPVRWYRRSQSRQGMNLVDRPDHSFAGFGFKRHGWAELPKPTWVVLVPMWFVTAATALPPGLWLLGAYRRRRAAERNAKGLCARCGYDLRASPGRCPECGASPAIGAKP
jgi:hypothetical protein